MFGVTKLNVNKYVKLVEIVPHSYFKLNYLA